MGVSVWLYRHAAVRAAKYTWLGEREVWRRERVGENIASLFRINTLAPSSVHPGAERHREKMPGVVQVVARAEVATVEATAAVAVMSAKPGSVGVQRTRCSALMKLATDAAGAQAVVHTRGMTAVVAAMGQHGCGRCGRTAPRMWRTVEPGLL